jgi:hypothetical protein
MGYEMKYSMSVEPEERLPDVYNTAVALDEFITSVLQEDGASYDSRSHSHCAETLQKVSGILPDVTIHLRMEGEDAPDIHVHTFRAGKVHMRCVRVIEEIEPFDPAKQTPVLGVNYQLAANFGQALNNLAYQTPRTIRISLGTRF